MNRNFSYIRNDQVVSAQALMPDTRRSSTVFLEFFTVRGVAAGIMLLSMFFLVIAPETWVILFFVVLPFVHFNFKRLDRTLNRLPFNLPFTHDGKDPNAPLPGRKGFEDAAGVFLAGKDLDTGEELWLNNNVLKQHFLVFGTTGSGKTEALCSMGSNFLAMDAGLIYNDAKAAPKLAWQLYTIARYLGRDDDFLAINYLTGGENTKRDQASRLSHDSAPFANGNASTNSNLVISLMPEESGNNKVFAERAVALVSAIMPALVELRDSGLIEIDPDIVRSFMEYNNCMSLMEHWALSMKAKRSIAAFANSLAGYDPNKPHDKQQEEVTRQFGFAQAYFTRALSTLSDVYGHIYMTGAGEVDFRDVILQDRILVTLLPSMEQAGEELKNLGRIILSAIRAAMAVGLGSELEGLREDVLDSLPTNTNKPSGIINDEYAYMAVKGFAITATQGRGLNFSLGFAGQDYAGWKAEAEKEAQSIVANCRFKYIMALEDAEDTKNLVKGIVGEVWTYITTGQSRDDNTLLQDYRSDQKVTPQKVDRIDPNDLRNLDVGEGFGLYKSSVNLMANFWHGFTDNDLISEFQITRRPIVDHRPVRGDYVKLLDRHRVLDREQVRVWLDTLDFPLNNPDIVQSVSMERIYEIAPAVIRKTTSGQEMGAGLFACLSSAYSTTPNGESNGSDSGSSSAGVFSNRKGSFGSKGAGNKSLLAGMSSEEPLSQQEPAETSSMPTLDKLNSLFDNDLDVDVEPLPAPPAGEEDIDLGAEDPSQGPDLDKSEIESKIQSDLDSLFETSEKTDIAHSVAKVELQLGADKDSAIDSAISVAREFENALKYPSGQVPKRPTNARTAVRNLLNDILGEAE